jgi:hypothetical protein
VKKRLIIFTCIISYSLIIFAQGEIDLQPKVFYRNEWSIAFLLNSNGVGGNYRYGKRIDARNKRLFEVDFAYMKHPKESRTYTISGAKAVYGKTNLAFDWHFAYGKQHEMFRKHDVGSVAIRYFYNYGPALVMLKPVYYNVVKAVPVYDSGGRFIGVQYQRWGDPAIFDPTWYNDNKYVESRASFFKGFDKLSFVPGIFGKFGFNFEFSKKDRIIHALECGVTGEVFAKKLKIMDFSAPAPGSTDVAKNQQFFLTVFVSYRFGRIVDPYEVKKSRKHSTEISY